MIWGGTPADGTDDGALYDPETDSWTPLPASGAPSWRTAYSVVWTGAEAIVWGGLSRSTPLGDGARYVPD
jgi:hypothetical protein